MKLFTRVKLVEFYAVKNKSKIYFTIAEKIKFLCDRKIVEKIQNFSKTLVVLRKILTKLIFLT